MSFAAIQRACEAAVSERAFPGFAWAVGSTDCVETGWGGRFRYESEPEQNASVDDETRFDLASLTKVVATTSVAMAAVEQGFLSLEDRVGRFVQAYGEGEKESITIADLLLHQSGLPPYLRCEGAGMFSHEIREAIHTIPLDAPPRTRADYSCLSFITLQSILEQVLGQDLNTSFIKLVRNQIGLQEASFVPSQQERGSIAPTETDTDWRDPYRRMARATYLQGDVHDPLAFMLGGISGNAGLFAGIDDMAKFAQTLLQVHLGKVGSFVGQETLRRWTVRQSVTGTRALGWDTNAEPSEGDLLAPTAFMHTGYTGTSIWVSPEQNAFGVLLTNRVYPDDANLAIREFRLKFRNLALQAIG